MYQFLTPGGDILTISNQRNRDTEHHICKLKLWTIPTQCCLLWQKLYHQMTAHLHDPTWQTLSCYCAEKTRWRDTDIKFRLEETSLLFQGVDTADKSNKIAPKWSPEWQIGWNIHFHNSSDQALCGYMAYRPSGVVFWTWVT